MTGKLYVISTPIGNMGDFSSRGIHLLRECDLIVCEDTRVTGKLLAAHSIKHQTMISYREENERFKAEEILKLLQDGKQVALVCDAGTPTISDPGFRLVRACRREDVPIEVCPGPCAAVAALSVSGLPSDRYYFVGFLPPKSAARRKFLTCHSDFSSTIICYESVHRIVKFLVEITEVLGVDRTLCVARELTKKFETVSVGRSQDVLDTVQNQALKGEFVVLIAPKDYIL